MSYAIVDRNGRVTGGYLGAAPAGFTKSFGVPSPFAAPAGTILTTKTMGKTSPTLVQIPPPALPTKLVPMISVAPVPSILPGKTMDIPGPGESPPLIAPGAASPMAPASIPVSVAPGSAPVFTYQADASPSDQGAPTEAASTPQAGKPAWFVPVAIAVAALVLLPMLRRSR